MAVIFADIVGSTPMSEALDPEEFREVMNQCFHALTEPISAYGGTVDKFIGDCIMALFGAPHAHENDAERAVRAALEMQRVAARLGETIKLPISEPIRLRVGLNCGMVIAGEVGSSHKRDYTAMGRVVNVAERMQKLCKPGHVMVSESVYSAVRRLFEFEDMGEHPVKGVANDVRVYRVVSARSGEATTRGLEEIGFATYVNRTEELESIKRAVERGLQGTTAVISVTGPAGMGKSRLISECQRQTEPLNISWFWARCLEYHRNVPYAPCGSLVAQVMGLGNDSRAVSRDRLDALEGLPDDGKREDILTGLSFVLRDSSESERPRRQLHGEEIQRCIYDGVEFAIGRLLEHHALAIVIDDLQWCDRASLDLFSHLLERFSASRLILCLSYRSHSPPEWEPLESAHEVKLGRLSRKDTERLVFSILDKTNDYEALSECRKLILDRCEGNPLFVEEMVKLLMDEGLLTRKEGLWEVHGHPDQAHLPDSLRGMVMARVDRLQDVEKTVLQMLAVLGPGAKLEFLSELSDAVDVELARAAASRLVELQILNEQTAEGGASYYFSRVFFGDAIYDSLLKRKRRFMHSRAATLLEARLSESDRRRSAILAYHWERAGDFEKGYFHTKDAAKQAASIYANRDAIELYQKAIELLKKWQEEPAPDELLGLMNDLAQGYYLTGNPKRSIDVLREQIELAMRAKNDSFLAKAHNNIGLLYEFEGDWNTARGHFRQAADIAWRIGDKTLAGCCLMNEGRLEVLVGSLRAAQEAFESALQLAEATGSKRLRFDLLTNLALMNLYACNLDKAEDWGKSAEQMATAQQDEYNLAWAHRVLGETRLYMGRLDEAHASFEEYLRLANQMDASDLQCDALRFLAETERLYLSAEEVIKRLRPALSTASMFSHLEERLDLLRMLLITYLRDARFELAGKVADRLAKEAEKFGEHRQRICSLLDRCEWALTVGDLPSAEEQLSRVGPLLELSGMLMYKPLFLLHSARTSRLAGRGDEAVCPLEEAVGLCQARGAKLLLARCLAEKALAHFDRAEYDLGRDTAERGIEVCRDIKMVPGDRSQPARTYLEEELHITLAQCLHSARKWPPSASVMSVLSEMVEKPKALAREAKALCLLGLTDHAASYLDDFVDRCERLLGRIEHEKTKRGVQLGLGIDWFARRAAVALHQSESEKGLERLKRLFPSLG